MSPSSPSSRNLFFAIVLLFLQFQLDGVRCSDEQWADAQISSPPSTPRPIILPEPDSRAWARKMSPSNSAGSSSRSSSSEHYVRPLMKIIDLYPRFGVSTGADPPSSEKKFRGPLRSDRMFARSAIQMALERLGTSEMPLMFPRPIYTLPPQIPFPTFVRTVAQSMPEASKAVPSHLWLNSHLNDVIAAVDGFMRFGLQTMTTDRSTNQTLELFAEWYARLVHYGTTPRAGQAIFRQVALTFIPGFEEIPDSSKGDVIYLFDSLCVARVLQLALQCPEYIMPEKILPAIESLRTRSQAIKDAILSSERGKRGDLRRERLKARRQRAHQKKQTKEQAKPVPKPVPEPIHVPSD